MKKRLIIDKHGVINGGDEISKYREAFSLQCAHRNNFIR